MPGCKIMINSSMCSGDFDHDIIHIGSYDINRLQILALYNRFEYIFLVTHKYFISHSGCQMLQ